MSINTLDQIEDNNLKKQNKDDLKSQYKKQVEKYIEKSILKNPDCFSGQLFIDNEFNNFKVFLEDNGDLSNFGEEFLKQSFCKNALKNTIISYNSLREKLYSSLDNKFDDQFDLDNLSKIKVIDEIKKLSNQELKDLNIYSSQREKFIKKQFKLSNEDLNKLLKEEIEENKKLLKLIFGSIGSNNLLDDESLIESLNKIIKLHKIGIEDIKNIINSLSKNEEKISFLNYFLPTISLKDAIELNLIDNVDCDKIKNNFKNKYGIELEESLFDSYFINTKDIKTIKLEKLLEDENLDKMISKIVKEINIGNEIILEDLEIENYNDFIKKVNLSNDINNSIKQKILSFKKGDYLNIGVKNSNNKFIDNFFYLGEINQSGFVFKNINKGEKKVNKNNFGETEIKSFKDFYESLVNISNNEEKIKLDIFDENEFNGYKTSNNIEEIPDSSEITSFEDLQKLMQEIDRDYKGPDFKSFAFLCKPLQQVDEENKQNTMFEEELFIVDKIENQEVFLRGQKPMSLLDFGLAFEERKPKRMKLLNNRNDFFEEFKSNENYKESLKDYELKDGKILPKNKKTPLGYDGLSYFVGEKGECIRIKKLDNGSVSFEQGVFEEGKKENDKTTFETKIKGDNIDYNSFFIYIKNKKLKPYTKDIKIEEKEVENNKVKRKGSILKSYMGWLSIREIISGGQQIISSIEQSLKTGNKLKSAKFALALGKYLPASIRDDLQSMVEGEEKKTMEELLSSLTTIDSKIMIPKIKRILLSKSSGQYEIEAALFAMLSKYGTLYLKELKGYRGSYLWYEALGGKVGDKLFLEVKKECLDASESINGKPSPRPFTEEYLVERLLGKQANGDLQPKRRSKIHKEMGSHINSGINAELEDGINKAGDLLTLKGRMNYSLGQFKDGGYANGIGALEKVWARGGNASEMHTMPFVITITGIAKNFPEKLLGKFLSMGWSSAYTEIMFNKDSNSIERFKKSIEEIILSTHSKESEIYKRFSSIGNDVEKAYNFWSSYGGELTDRMTLKDGYIFAKKDENETFKQYYNFVNGVQSDIEYNIKKEDISSGVFSYENTPFTLSSGRKIYEEYVSFPNGICRGEGQLLLDNVIKQLKDLKNKNYDEDKNKDLEIKKKIFKELYILAHANIVSQGNWYEQVLKTKEVKDLEKNGIDIKGFGIDLADLNTPEGNDDKVYGYTKSEAFQSFLDKKFKDFVNLTPLESDVNENRGNYSRKIDEIILA